MYAIINTEELVEPLADKLILQRLAKIHPQWQSTVEYISKCDDDFSRTKLISVDFNQINSKLHQDLRSWRDEIITEYKGNYRKLVNWLAENIDDQFDRDYLIDLCIKDDTRESFIKSLAKQLDSETTWMLRGESIDSEDPVLIRNIVGNENVIKQRMENKLPFWFIDSGYTNFLTGKKNWHRLVKDSLHYSTEDCVFPADRLSMFSRFPRPWFSKGDRILVIESSEQHYKMNGTTLDAWRQRITREIRQQTDRPIDFKPKDQDRKTRTSVHDLLQAKPKEYYCVISDSSAGAVEAVWNGIPIITLSTHITNPIARKNIGDINDLYRGPIGEWLCALSYSQFTKDEMFNGTALKIMKKFHNV